MMLSLLFLTLTIMANANTTILKKSTTTETYDWERCQGGKGSGPRGYERLCDGEHHGECIGKTGAIAEAYDTDSCADECNENESCAGFEYDTHGDEQSCTLFETVTGLKATKKESHLFTHECFKKEVVKPNICESVRAFSGRYQRMCDFKKHGACSPGESKQLGSMLEHETAELCASACDGNSKCAGFEFDTDEDSNSCFLYSEVTHAEYHKFTKTYQCYKKSSLISTTTTPGATTVAANTTMAGGTTIATGITVASGTTMAGGTTKTPVAVDLSETAQEASTASRTNTIFVLSVIMTFLTSTN